MLGHQSARLCQRWADNCHPQGAARHHPKRRAGQRIDPLGVKLRPIQTADKPANVPQTPAHMLRLSHAPNLSLADTKVLRSGCESALYRVSSNEGIREAFHSTCQREEGRFYTDSFTV